MKNEVIKSKGGSQFHPMVSVILFLCCVPAFASGNWGILVVLIILMLVTWILDKTVHIDVNNRKYKDGLFSGWDDLSVGGYISIFNEKSGQKMQAVVQSTKVVIKELKLNYIQGKAKKSIYVAKSKEEAERIALQLAEEWDVGVYDGLTRTWLKEKTS